MSSSWTQASPPSPKPAPTADTLHCLDDYRQTSRQTSVRDFETITLDNTDANAIVNASFVVV